MVNVSSHNAAKSMMSDVTEPVLPSETTSAGRAFYHREGYVILPGLITPETVRTLHAQVLEVMAIEGLGLAKLRQFGQFHRGATP